MESQDRVAPFHTRTPGALDPGLCRDRWLLEGRTRAPIPFQLNLPAWIPWWIPASRWTCTDLILHLINE